MEGICLLISRVLDPDAPDQKALGVDPIRGAGQQGAVVLALDDLQVLHVVWLDNVNRVDLIADLPVQDRDRKAVAKLDLVQVGKQGRAWQAAVANQDGMGRLAANRQARALQVANPVPQHGLGSTMVDRQMDPDLWNVDIGHHVSRW